MYGSLKAFFGFSIGCLFFLFAWQAAAQNVAQRFSEFDPNSKVHINHQPLTDYLQQTVLPVGRSYRVLGSETPDTYRGSRIKTAKSLSPSRFEGSRLLLSFMEKNHEEFFKSYQEGLERLSNRRALKDLNKNEQLAFWLNLYNVVVINKLIQEYPLSNLKSLRSSKRGKTSFWDEKVTAVEGVPLSLKDIEAILFTNFDKPTVAFGLWQGSIGGPRLLSYAYTGTNVWRALENNAVEFVNSNRGLRPPTGTRMSVSDFFEWTLPAFGTNEGHVLSFIKEYADPNFVQGVEGVSSVNFKLYDWTVADLMGGSKHSGSSNQLGGVLTGGSGGPENRGSGGAFDKTQVISATPGAGESATAVVNVIGQMNSFLSLTPVGSLEGLPTQAIQLLEGIKYNNRQPMTFITTTECAPGEDCTVENPTDGNNP